MVNSLRTSVGFRSKLFIFDLLLKLGNFKNSRRGFLTFRDFIYFWIPLGSCWELPKCKRSPAEIKLPISAQLCISINLSLLYQTFTIVSISLYPVFLHILGSIKYRVCPNTVFLSQCDAVEVPLDFGQKYIGSVK